jgi:Protein of unknown function (DUF2795)
MERGSDKHGPRLDEQLEHEDEPIVRSGQPPHTEEWRETEPFEDEHVDLNVPGDEAPGAPPGMTAADVERRSEIARWLEPHKFPSDRDTIVGYLQQEGAPDEVVDAIATLPAGRTFSQTGDVVRALGIPTEHRRT